MARRDTVSQYSTDTIGIGIYEKGKYVNADGDTNYPNGLVLISIVKDDEGNNPIISGDEVPGFEELGSGVETIWDGLGLYSFSLTTDVTSFKGNYTARWAYRVDGQNKIFEYQFEVVDPQPFFDSLNAEQKQLVDNIYHRVSDGFDSTQGGPYLWELPQSSFNYETVARLMVVDAMNMINYSRPKAFIPPYGIGSTSGKQIPPAWYGLVEKAASYELYKHLSRSYLEIPAPVGVDVAHLDRREYSDKWMKMAEYEKEELETQLRMLKRALQYGVRTRSSLLAGGIFPVSYLNPARPRWPYTLTRFY